MTCCKWIWDDISHDFICTICGDSWDRMYKTQSERVLQKKMGSTYDPSGDSGTIEDQWIQNQTADRDDNQSAAR